MYTYECPRQDVKKKNPQRERKFFLLIIFFFFFYLLIIIIIFFFNVCNQYLPELQYKAKSKCEVEFVFFTCFRSIRVLYFVIMLVHM